MVASHYELGYPPSKPVGLAHFRTCSSAKYVPMFKSFVPILTLLVLLILPTHFALADRLPAIDNAFNEPDAGAWFDGWTAGDPAIVSRASEPDAAFVRLQVAKAGTAMIER